MLNRVYLKGIILKVLGEKNSIPMKDIGKETGLDASEVKIAIGWLIQKEMGNY